MTVRAGKHDGNGWCLFQDIEKELIRLRAIDCLTMPTKATPIREPHMVVKGAGAVEMALRGNGCI
jgi:hypothetical protein